MPTINNLPPLTQATGTIAFPVVDYNTDPDTTRKATFLQFRDYLESTAAVKSVVGRIGEIVLTYEDIGGISTVGHSGSFNDLLDKPISFPISTASTTVLGGVKVDGVTITINNGVISGGVTYTLPAATTSTLGGVIIGNNINFESSIISLSTATTSTLGLIKIGDNLSISDDGTLSSFSAYTLPIATTSTLGGVIIDTGSGLNLSPEGRLAVNNIAAQTVSPILTINAGETGPGVTSGTPGDNLYKVAGLQIYRGTDTSGSYILYTDLYEVDDGVSVTTGSFALVSNASGGALIINKIRLYPFTNELNIFGANDPNGIISVSGTTDYETNVTDDDHIPNKKYVDDKVATTATSTTTGVVKIGSSITASGDGTISAVGLSNGLATWELDNLYGDLHIPDFGAIYTVAGYPSLISYNSTQGPELDWVDGTSFNDFLTPGLARNSMWINGNGLFLHMDANSASISTQFSTSGTIFLPPGGDIIRNGVSVISTATSSRLGLVKIGSGLASYGDGTIYVTGGGGGASIVTQDEGGTLSTQTSSINFIGAGVIATAVGNDVTVTINGGGGGSFTGGSVPSAINELDGTPSSNSSTGAITVVGGIGVGQNSYFGAGLTVKAATATTSTYTGAMTVVGGIGVGGSIFVNNAVTATNVRVTSYTNATSTLTGALTVAGGIGVGASVFVANTVTAASFVNAGAGTPTIQSPTSIILDAQTEVNVLGSPFRLWSRTVSQLTLLGGVSAGAMAFCTDESGGAVPVFYDGTNWRRMTDRNIIS